MNDSRSTFEQSCAENFVSEYVSRGRLADVLPILSLISESYGGIALSDKIQVTKKNVMFVRQFIRVIKRSNSSFSATDFVQHGHRSYLRYISSVDVHLLTDTAYGEEIKNYIGNICKDVCQVKEFRVHEKISTTHGGGFLVRFRDYQFDASYTQGLLS